MKQAFILAAGLGTRLKPLTNTMPKALVPVCGKPLLQHQIERLLAAGFTRIVINVHHFADQIVDFVEKYKEQHAKPHDVEFFISDEREELLETGGALRKATPLFLSDSPILIHNVDILHNLDLAHFYDSHAGDATLLVSHRDTSRYLLFNDDRHLVGWTNVKTGEVKPSLPSGRVEGNLLLAFSGIHILSPSLLSDMQAWPSRFSIIDFYLSVCHHSVIQGVECSSFRMVDVGKLDTLASAEDFLLNV